jgi:hypothetical protein
MLYEKRSWFELIYDKVRSNKIILLDLWTYLIYKIIRQCPPKNVANTICYDINRKFRTRFLANPRLKPFSILAL